MNARIPDFACAAAPTWQADDDGGLVCAQVRDETHDVKTFVLQAPSARSFRYLPGQFITLELDIDGERVNRCYTLSSTPTRPDRVSITVKRVPGGRVSNWLHEHLRVGSRLNVMGPAGQFSCFAQPAERYLFLSGGSGITPLMSMSRALHDLASDADIVFVHCARTPADVLFADELALLAKNLPHFRLALVCEQRGAQSAYAGYLGRISQALLDNIAPDLLARDIYTCGPAPFMAAVRAMLGAAGYDMRRYREESFSFETLSSAETPASTTDFVIKLARIGQEFRCGADERLLGAAQRAGLRLPFSCSSGVCGTCKTHKLSGEVVMAHSGGIRQREIDQGFILPCCSRPLSDVVLDR
ncbi:2Fe-2S iron-sulfur cluster binding domain-containing protein [Aquincola sp. S2]|uniref:2Fe-2S iron-sulfur cluster binding domain-containing protein n=1 Tax=Pseudaquabacterium terrae TaxID=2732868 RepID=A0ABX2EU68_9BURK|nr:FAD-binding oxidoreductase [Aquabacterium terrae]NRF72285.1 2Fe-2S iron-sulfur cluster binding domain-containing protein [Aquabacterium terrae]